MIFEVKNGFLLLTAGILLGCFSSGCNCQGHRDKMDGGDLPVAVSIDVEQQREVGKLSFLVDSSYFIALETSEEGMIGSVDKLVLTDRFIFLMDREQGAGIYVFHLDGRFAGRTGVSGRGPGEIVELMDFVVDEAQQHVIVCDGATSKLVYYDYAGNYIKEVKLPFPPYNFEMLDSGFAFIGSGKADNLLITDALGNRVASFYPYNERLSIGLLKHFSVYRDTVIYQQTGNDTLYAVIGGRPVAHRYFHILNGEPGARIYGIEIPDQISGYMENERFAWFAYQYRDAPRYFLYDKGSGKIKMYSNETIDDIMGYPYAPRLLTVHRDYFVGIIQPYLLLEDNDLYKLHKDRFHTDISSESNPVLGFYKFRNF